MMKDGFKKRLKWEVPVGILAIAAFVFLLLRFGLKEPAEPDLFLHDWFVEHRTEILNRVFLGITFLGNWQFLIPVLAFLLLIRPIRLRVALPLAAATLEANVFYQVTRRLVCRVRPSSEFWLIQEHGFGFPSGHAVSNLTLYVLLGMILFDYGREKRTKEIRNFGKAGGNGYVFFGILSILLGILIGVSRIYIGVHWTTDVLAGWSMGIVFLLLNAELFHIGFAREKRKLYRRR